MPDKRKSKNKTPRPLRPPKSQKAKRSTKTKKKRAEMLAHFGKFLDKVAEEPRIWVSNDAKFLRDFVQHVQANTTTYQFPLGDATGDPREDAVVGTVPQLDPNFVASLETDDYDHTDLGHQPIVRVVGCSLKIDRGGFADQTCKRYNLNIIDGAGRFVWAVTSTNLYHDVKRQLVRDGSPIIKLRQFNTVYYTPDSNNVSIKMPGVVILDYQFLCCPQDNLDASAFEPARPLNVAEAQSTEEPINNTTDTRDNVIARNTTPDDGNTFHQKIQDFQSSGEFEPLPRVEFCTPSRRLCSCYGVSASYCIAEQQSIESLSLDAVAEQCQFVTMEVSEMDNSKKRNLLYWWFATNLYCIVGSKNRKRLPSCFECAIRMAYPNEKGKPYKEYCGSN